MFGWMGIGRARCPVNVLVMAMGLCVFLLGACAVVEGDRVPPLSGKGHAILVTITEPDNAQRAMMSSFSRSYHRAGYPIALSVRHTLNQLGSDYQLTEVDGWSIHTLGVYCALFTVSVDRSREQLLEQLQQDPRVESAQAMQYYSALGGDSGSANADENQLPDASRQQPLSYNDPYFTVQYREHAESIVQLHHWATGKGVTVAVIDTGVDTGHPELAGQVVGRRNFVDGNQDQFSTDIHGTAVAGIIAATAGNNEGIVGIAPEATLWALKACWQLREQSSEAQCNSFTLASALSFAIDQQLDIINISLSGPSDPLVARLVAAAIDDGRIVVAADPVVGRQRYPALLPGVIAVQQPTGDKVLPIEDAVVVSGVDVLSTGPGGGYDFFSGSSVSTAIVTGYTALLHEKNPMLSHQQRLLRLQDVRMINDSHRPASKAISLHGKSTALSF